MRNAVEITALAFKGFGGDDSPNLDFLREAYPELSFAFDELERLWSEVETLNRFCDDNERTDA